jgi:hypothetical protein
MKFDRKLLLIIPAVVLVCVCGGMFYVASQLRLAANGSSNWTDRRDYIAAVERGERALDPRQAVSLARIALDVEARRTVAIEAAYQLLIVLSGMLLASCVVLVIGVRGVRREHWPRFGG